MPTNNSEKNLFHNIIDISCFIPYKQLILYQAGFLYQDCWKQTVILTSPKKGTDVFLP